MGGLDVQFMYYRGLNECRASRWVSEAERLAELMSRIDCRGGHTQIGKVLAHAKRESQIKKVQALVFVGDAMEESLDDLCHAAGELGLLGVPTFMFQEGGDPVAEQAFREIAKLTRGAYCRFDLGAAHQLGELLRAVAAYAAGGMRTLNDLSARRQAGAIRLLEQNGVAMALIFGIVVLALALWALHSFSQANPRMLAIAFKTGGGLSALALAGFLGLRGRLDIAVPLGLTGLGLLGWLPWSSASLGSRTQKSTGQVSRVLRSWRWSSITIRARCGAALAGPHEHADLNSLDVATLVECLVGIDEESHALLMAYLDRREPGWREHAQAGAASRAGRAGSSGKMTEEEASRIPWRESGGERRGDRGGLTER